jgi:hypothetical protein
MFFGSQAIAQSSKNTAIENLEKAKIEHELEVRKLALEAISKVMPSINRLTQKQDNANVQKCCKMIESFAASGSYPAYMIPLPSIASEFIEKRRASAERVLDAYKELKVSGKQEFRNELEIENLEQEMLKFIDNEKECQSQKPVNVNQAEKTDGVTSDTDLTDDLYESKDGENGLKIKKYSAETDKIFEAYEKLAKKIEKELADQETTALLQKARQNANRQLANFWRNKQLSFLCEVDDLSATGEANYHFLSFSYIEKSDRPIVIPLSSLTNKIVIPVSSSKLGDYKPGRRFRLIVNVISSFDPRDEDPQPLGYIEKKSSKENIQFSLYITRLNIEWVK